MNAALAIENAPGPWTWDDYVKLDEDDRRELVDGHLVEIDMPTLTHERLVAVLIMRLGRWAEEHQAGWVCASGYKVRVSNKRGVMPDVQYYRHGSQAPLEEQGLASGHPDLVVEIVSPSSRSYDRVTKLNWYASLGVPEYWIVDPAERTLVAQVLREGCYATIAALEGEAVFRPDSMPGLELPLRDLWQAAGLQAPTPSSS